MIAADGVSVRDGVAGIVLEGLAQDDRGIIITDSDQKICWWNESAREVLRLDPALRCQSGLLVADGQPALRELGSIIARSAAGLAEGVVPFSRQRGCYLMRVRRIREDSWLYIELAADHGPATVRYFDLSVIFGLTATEKKTALLMLAGLGASDIATNSGVAIDTVRSHIRAIYSKMGVATREQFFARTNALRM